MCIVTRLDSLFRLLRCWRWIVWIVDLKFFDFYSLTVASCYLYSLRITVLRRKALSEFVDLFLLCVSEVPSRYLRGIEDLID